MIELMTSAEGFPVRLHPETASCSNFKLAKVFVNVDLSKELPNKINFTKNGKSSLVEFIYPWLPLRYHTCGKWGHIAKVCVMNKKDGSEKSVQQIIKEGIKEKEAETGGSVVIGKGNEGNKEGDDVVNKEKVGQQSIKSTEDIEEGEIVKDWLDVTPGKAGRGSNTLKYGQVGILTPSRFSALLEVDEKGDTINPIEIEEILSI